MQESYTTGCFGQLEKRSPGGSATIGDDSLDRAGAARLQNCALVALSLWQFVNFHERFARAAVGSIDFVKWAAPTRQHDNHLSNCIALGWEPICLYGKRIARLMEAHVKTVREILHSGDQFLVPFFQRQYSWTKKEWQNLYSDVLALMDGDEDAKHFLGPLVCTPFHPVPGEVTPYQLIDGQQRLTTLTLALAALRDDAREKKFGDFADEIHEDFLIHRRRQGLSRFKVVPRLEDRHSYDLAIDGTAPGVVAGEGIIGCHSFFKRAWRTPVADGGEPVARRILAALTARMSLVAITVDGENPYEIFESLNWKGLELEEADLIRNYLFMEVPTAEQDQFHNSQWKPLALQFEPVVGKDKDPPTSF